MKLLGIAPGALAQFSLTKSFTLYFLNFTFNLCITFGFFFFLFFVVISIIFVSGLKRIYSSHPIILKNGVTSWKKVSRLDFFLRVLHFPSQKSFPSKASIISVKLYCLSQLINSINAMETNKPYLEFRIQIKALHFPSQRSNPTTTCHIL